VAEAEEKLRQLYKMVEDGVTDLDDILKDRLAPINLDPDRSRLALERIRPPNAHPAHFEPKQIERFGRAMRENITYGEIPFRTAYIQSVVDRIEVDDSLIRILGSKATLKQAIAGRAVGSAGGRSFERKWRATLANVCEPPRNAVKRAATAGSGVALSRTMRTEPSSTSIWSTC
jgi:site-specific DNA recombinase